MARISGEVCTTRSYWAIDKMTRTNKAPTAQDAEREDALIKELSARIERYILRSPKFQCVSSRYYFKQLTIDRHRSSYRRAFGPTKMTLQSLPAEHYDAFLSELAKSRSPNPSKI